VKDLDREVLALLAEDLLVLLLDDLAGAVMGIDDVVTELELDVLDFPDDLEVFEELLFGDIGDDSVLLGCDSPALPVSLMSAGSGPRD
jgi:hypothetical protein